MEVWGSGRSRFPYIIISGQKINKLDSAQGRMKSSLGLCPTENQSLSFNILSVLDNLIGQMKTRS